MPRTQLNVRVPDSTLREIESLTEQFGYESQSHVIMTAVTRLHLQENSRMNTFTITDNASGNTYTINADEYRKHAELPEDFDGTPNDSEDVVWLNVDYLKSIGEDVPEDWPDHLPMWELRP